MNQDEKLEMLKDLESTDPILRVGAFVIACGLIFLLVVVPANQNGDFYGFFAGLLIFPCLLYCYAGVSNPITKTLLGLSMILAPLALISDMDSPIDARLKGDTSNPNYWRSKK